VGPGLGLAIVVVTFIGAFIPVVGAFAIGVVATLVTLAVAGTTPALVVLAIVTVVQQVEGNFLSPYVMGRAVRLHPMAVLMVLSAAGTLLGILGALVAVPMAAAVHEGAKYLRARYGW
jgi:predicted PurR-regulated permease PerM